jgi:hypothetical protein
MKHFIIAVAIAQAFTLYVLFGGVITEYDRGEYLLVTLYVVAFALLLTSLISDVSYLLNGLPRVVGHPDRVEVVEWLRTASYRRGSTSVHSFMPESRILGVVHLQDVGRGSVYFRYLMKPESFETLLALGRPSASEPA